MFNNIPQTNKILVINDPKVMALIDRLNEVLEDIRNDRKGDINDQTMQIIKEALDQKINIDFFLEGALTSFEEKVVLLYKDWFLDLYICFIERDISPDILFKNVTMDFCSFFEKFILGKWRRTIFVKGMDDLISRGARLCSFKYLLGNDIPKGLHKFLGEKQRKLKKPQYESHILLLFERYEPYFEFGEDPYLCYWSLVRHGYTRVIDFLQSRHCVFKSYCFHSNIDIFSYIHKDNIDVQFLYYLRGISYCDEAHWRISDFKVPRTEVYEVISRFINFGANPYTSINPFEKDETDVREYMVPNLCEWYQANILDCRTKPCF